MGRALERHVNFFLECAKEARSVTMMFRMGAVVVKNGKVIGRGSNKHLRNLDYGLPSSSWPSSAHVNVLPLSVHAEVSALRSATPHYARTSLAHLPSYSIPSASARSPPPFIPPPHRLLPSTKSPLMNSTLYVGRFNGNEQPMQAKPCWRCVQAMAQHGVRKVLWTTGTDVEEEEGKATTADSSENDGVGGTRAVHLGGPRSPSPQSSRSSKGKAPSVILDPRELLWEEAKVLDLWEEILETKDLVETGWLTGAEEHIIATLKAREQAVTTAPVGSGKDKGRYSCGHKH